MVIFNRKDKILNEWIVKLAAYILVLLLASYFMWPLIKLNFELFNGGSDTRSKIDWYLLAIFLYLSGIILSHVNFKNDLLTIMISGMGGFCIEYCGTNTQLWHYFTNETPPLWVIPAWAIGSLTTQRLAAPIIEKLDFFINTEDKLKKLKIIYWITFGAFFTIMLDFVSPFFHHHLTVLTLLIVAIAIFNPVDIKKTLVIFLVGSLLGYVLEIWGTSRQCWIYYNNQTPPIFAVMGHGMACVLFYRFNLVIRSLMKWAYSFKFGRPEAIVFKPNPLSIKRIYRVQWKKTIINPEQLAKLYWVDGLTQLEIARMYKIRRATISAAAQKFKPVG